MCRVYAILILCLVACDPFNLSPTTDNKNHLELITEYDIDHKLIDTLSVKLLWSDITIDNFKEIEIHRYNYHRELDSYVAYLNVKGGWYPVFETENFFVTTYNDIVDDDAPFKYRLRYYDENRDYIEAIDSIFIKPTTSVFVPSEFDSVSFALNSYIVDAWDTIFVCMSEFDTFPDTLYDTKPDTFYLVDTVLVIDIPCN